MIENHNNLTLENSLFDNGNFVPLAEIDEEELPSVDNEFSLEINNKFASRVLGCYFRHMYGSERDVEIAKKFYGIENNPKSINELAEEYSLSRERIKQIVSKPYSRWKSRTTWILNLIKTEELNPLKKLKEEDNFIYHLYSFLEQ